MKLARGNIGTVARSRIRPPRKQADSHYNTPEHRSWRAAVLSIAKGRCEGCGAEGGRLYADHIVELRDGGAPFDPANGQALCASCHTSKTAQARAERHKRR